MLQTPTMNFNVHSKQILKFLTTTHHTIYCKIVMKGLTQYQRIRSDNPGKIIQKKKETFVLYNWLIRGGGSIDACILLSRSNFIHFPAVFRRKLAKK